MLGTGKPLSGFEGEPAIIKGGQEDLQHDMQSYSLHPAFASSFLADGPSKFSQARSMFSVARPPSVHDNNQDPQGLVENYSGHIYTSQPNNSANIPPHAGALADLFTARPGPYSQYNFQRNETYANQNQYQSYPQMRTQESNLRLLYHEQAQMYNGVNVLFFYL
jgi:hypothetical protein